MSNPQEIREKLISRVKFNRTDLPGLADELENIYNYLESQRIPTSETFLKLVLWVRQEEQVLRSPEYDPNFKCDACGFGKDDVPEP